MKEKLNQYLYFIIVGIVSFLTLLVFPFLGSQVSVDFYIPQNGIEWAIFIVTRLLVAALNMFIYVAFVRQGKLNIKENPQYNEAKRILLIEEKKGKKPESPKQFYGKMYGKKGVTLFVSSLLSVVVLGEAVLTYDYTALISYGTVIVMGCVFGIFAMKETETYWTETYYEYAIMIRDTPKEVIDDNNKQHDIPQPARTSGGESEEHSGNPAD